MRKIFRTKQFKKDFKRSKRQNKDCKLLKCVIDLLVKGKKLSSKYSDHSLHGDYVGCRECHVAPDWLLIYIATEKELKLVRLGSHSDLF